MSSAWAVKLLSFQFTRPRGARPPRARILWRDERFNSRAREGRDSRNYSILRDKALGGCFREPWLLSNIMQLSKSRVLRLPVAMQNIAAICIF